MQDLNQTDNVSLAGKMAKPSTKHYPIDCQRWDKTNGNDYNLLHWQREVDIMHVIEGKQVEVNFVNHTITFDAPAIFMIPGNQLHSIHCKGDCKINHILFEPSILEFQRFDEAQANMLQSLTDGMIAPFDPIRVGEPGFEQINNLLNFLDIFASSHEAGMRLQVKGCLIQILGVLYQYGYLNKRPIRRASGKNTREDRVKDLISYINNNYNHPLSIIDAANRINLSKQYFCRFFKDLTGMSFVEYLNMIRLKKVAQDILTTKDPINDIATNHGFDSISHFFKLFKQTFNCTPNQYRQRVGLLGEDSSKNTHMMCESFVKLSNIELNYCANFQEEGLNNNINSVANALQSGIHKQENKPMSRLERLEMKLQNQEQDEK